MRENIAGVNGSEPRKRYGNGHPAVAKRQIGRICADQFVDGAEAVAKRLTNTGPWLDLHGVATPGIRSRCNDIVLVGVRPPECEILASEARMLDFIPAVAPDERVMSSLVKTHGDEIVLAVLGDDLGPAIALKLCASLAASIPHSRLLYLSDEVNVGTEHLALKCGAHAVFGCSARLQHVLVELVLLARARSNPSKNSGQIRLGTLCIDVDRKRALIADRDLELTKTEFSILLRIVENRTRVTTDEELMRMLKMSEAKRAEWHVRNICAKISPTEPTKAMIRRRRGHGWVLDEQFLQVGGARE
jgi:DNA-binding response OmpR family regulator